MIQKISEKQGEVSPDEIMESFRAEYLDKKGTHSFPQAED